MLQSALASASRSLYTALNGRAFWGGVTVLLPNHWPDSCVPSQSPVGSLGETPDIRIGVTHPVHGDSVWTQQSKGCGQQGDFVYMSHKLLLEPRDIGELLVDVTY